MKPLKTAYGKIDGLLRGDEVDRNQPHVSAKVIRLLREITVKSLKADPPVRQAPL